MSNAMSDYYSELAEQRTQNLRRRTANLFIIDIPDEYAESFFEIGEGLIHFMEHTPLTGSQRRNLQNILDTIQYLYKLAN